MDEADMANYYVQQDIEHALAGIDASIPAGVPGECIRCGEESKRLIGGECAPCRDKYRRLHAITAR